MKNKEIIVEFSEPWNNNPVIDTNSEEYYQGWEDGVKECLELAESIDDTYIIVCLKEWLGYD